MLNKMLNILLFVFLLAFVNEAHANQSAISALTQVKQNNFSSAIAMRNGLSGTSRDVVNWALYNENASGISATEIFEFLSQNPDWPYQLKLQRIAEKKLQSSDSTAAYNFYARKAPITAGGMDFYLRLSQANGGMDRGKQVLNDWWGKTSLSREDQQKIYSSWESSLTRDAHITRLHSTLDKKEYSNGVAIGNALGGGYSALAKARQALGRGQGDAGNYISVVPANLQNDEGLLFDRLQWRRKKNMNSGAIEILNQSPRKGTMKSAKRFWKERHIIVRRLMEQAQYQQAYQLASSHQQTEGFPRTQAEWISGFLALRKVNEPYKAFEHFETLYKNVETPLSRSRGSYWAGRASEALNNTSIANQWYKVASKYPETFYGQLAGEKLGQQVSLPRSSSTNPSQGQRTSFNNKDFAQAATWLSKAGLDGESEDFLLKLKDTANSAQDYELTAALATELGKQQIAIKVAQDLQKKKNIVLGQYLYPQKVQELNGIHSTEWAFINAIIRQESRFDHTAVSHAGARGLMQLMPATAKQTASRAGLSHQRSWLTSRPSHNIALGSRYLGQMTNRYGGNYAMAAAAYNAGPGRVDRWVKEMGDPRYGSVDFIDWVEQIPIYETRNYVQRVLEGVYVYRDSLRGKQPSVGQPIHVATR